MKKNKRLKYQINGSSGFREQVRQAYDNHLGSVLNLYILSTLPFFLLSPFPPIENHHIYYKLEPIFHNYLKCPGPETSIMGITWKLIRNAHFQTPPRLTELESAF